jgi:hypothetical protein
MLKSFSPLYGNALNRIDGLAGLGDLDGGADDACGCSRAGAGARRGEGGGGAAAAWGLG